MNAIPSPLRPLPLPLQMIIELLGGGFLKKSSFLFTISNVINQVLVKPHNGLI